MRKVVLITAVIVVGLVIVAYSGIGNSNDNNATAQTIEDSSRIFGRIVNDVNGNGRWDKSEETFLFDPANLETCSNAAEQPSVTIAWTGAASGSTTPKRCNTGGAFYGTGVLPSGTYTLSVNVPTGWEVTGNASATVSLASGEIGHQWFFVRRSTWPDHLIGVRTRNGKPQFYHRKTGQQFVPRGNNFVRLAKQQSPTGSTVVTHSTFNVGEYDAQEAEQALASMDNSGYNVVRVFLSRTPQMDDADGSGLDLRYLANVADFLERAKQHDIVVMITQDAGIPRNYAPFSAPNLEALHAFLLSPRAISARQEFLQDFINGLRAYNAPMEYIFAYDIVNEIHFRTDRKPLSLSSGVVTTAAGSYDMASESDRRRMMEEGIVHLINESAKAIRALNPTALITTGSPEPSALDSPGDPRLAPPVAPLIEQSDADFADLHVYPHRVASMDALAKNYAIPDTPTKPIVMGEFGAFIPQYPRASGAANTLRDWQKASCKKGFGGWLSWTWDPYEQPKIDAGEQTQRRWWSVVDSGGAINGVLAPVRNPNVCESESTNKPGRILGRIINDTNGNGKKDAKETFIKAPSGPPETCTDQEVISGVGVSWTGPEPGSSVPDLCNPGGPYYSTGPVQPGTYTFSPVISDDWEVTGPSTQTITVKEGEVTGGGLFLIRKKVDPSVGPGRIIGRIVKDDNGNGKKDPGERFIKAPSGPANCTNEEAVSGIAISWSGPSSAQTVPDRCNEAGPFYSTGDLPSGDYSLTVRVPSGWEAIAPATKRVTVTGGKASHEWFFVRENPVSENNNAVRIIGPEEIVFDWTTDRCEDLDIPDSPVTAFRDANGDVQLIAGNSVNYRMKGPDFDRLQQDCANGIVLPSHKDWNPKMYDDHEWLQSVYTEDGQNIYAFIHVEYEGHRYAYPDGTPVCDGEHLPCQLSSTTEARSADMGASYVHAQPPNHLIATLPYSYDNSGAGIYGMFAPSNIIKNPKDGHYYALIRAWGHELLGKNEHGQNTFGYKDQKRGTCIMRTASLDNPEWRAWDGTGFNMRFIDPNTEAGFDPKDHVCTPLFVDNEGAEYTVPPRGLFWNTYLEQFVAVGRGVKYDPEQSRNVFGVYHSLSDDLIHWGDTELLWEVPSTNRWEPGGPDPVSYPTFIDHDSPFRSFDTLGKTAHLYFTRSNRAANGDTFTLDRDLIRASVEFFKAEATPSPGRIVGRIVKDDNGNGKKDPGEQFIKDSSGPANCTNEEVVSGIAISWSGPSSAQTVADRCNEAGPFYSTGGLSQGTYTLSLNVPTGWEISGPTPVSVAVKDDGEVSHQWFFVRKATAGTTNNASFVSQHVPTTMEAGSTQEVTITMKNVGNTTWISGRHHLGSQAPRDNTLWGRGRVKLPQNTSILPGKQHTFTFSITAPQTSGTYNFQWQMLEETIEWFGTKTLNQQITVTGDETPEEELRDVTTIRQQSPLITTPSTNKIYYITETGLKRWIPTSQIFTSYGNRWEDVIEVSQAELDAIPNNTLIRREGGTRVYLLENNTKRWITTADAFVRNGYDWSRIALVNQAELDYYEDGAVIE